MASYQSLQRKGSAAKRSTEIRVEGDAPRLGLSLAPKCHLKTGAAGGQLKGPNELKRPSPAGEAPDGHAQMRSLLLAASGSLADVKGRLGAIQVARAQGVDLLKEGVNASNEIDTGDTGTRAPRIAGVPPSPVAARSLFA
ncbi:hypothetical protein TRIATDRAFT_318449 [Trichoderma atroviride IMI 206040]|uniref:Uncharacterized protein n=1 Tax=Hypocrea atroviridis (strain ATCC 20476 / IMI 206040) TaxID=452589 RepID=G9NV55_HYPAI|nr:uncharacterized protein TRIATDRAFT_318449 [Trichoderma atroviride IMI 206040]EHK44877.1 hypothetical protein TRIATDRAFT_318449 [Trichoderma atroviride IMI 206040]